MFSLILITSWGYKLDWIKDQVHEVAVAFRLSTSFGEHSTNYVLRPPPAYHWVKLNTNGCSTLSTNLV